MEAIQDRLLILEANRYLDKIRGSFRIIAFFSLFVMYAASNLSLGIWYYLSPNGARPVLQKITRFYARLLAKAIGMKVKTNYQAKDYSSLLVANHMSYLDIIAILTVFPACFITSKEIEETPFLGHICKLAGCIFIERRSRMFLKDEIQEIADSLNGGYDVFLFPEGTSTNGEEVKRFKRPFFESAMIAKKNISLFVVNYLKINDHPVGVTNRDKLCWYGKMRFFPHFWNMVCLKSFEIEVLDLEAIDASTYDDVTELSIEAHKRISSNVRLIKN